MSRRVDRAGYIVDSGLSAPVRPCCQTASEFARKSKASAVQLCARRVLLVVQGFKAQPLGFGTNLQLDNGLLGIQFI